PLQCIMIPVSDEAQRTHIEAVKSLIINEVNVKEINFVDGTAGILVKKVKCDFKKLGPKFGKQMKAVAAAVGELPQEAIAELEKNGRYTLSLTDGEAVIEAADVEIISEDIPGWLVANEGKLTVALEVTVTEELRREGIARELVNRIQNIRKSSGFEITDKIRIRLSKNQETDDAVNEYNSYICNQVLGVSLELVDEVKDGTELNFDDFSLFVSVIKE
nr:isoleucine--tRNA ligase [Bacteroides sp.]